MPGPENPQFTEPAAQPPSPDQIAGNQATGEAQTRGLIGRAIDRATETVTNPELRQKVVSEAVDIGHTTLEGMGIINSDPQTGRARLNTEGAMAAIEKPKATARHFGREATKVTTGRAAAHVGQKIAHRIFGHPDSSKEAGRS
ncbi:MAG: hypothetical protein AAB971_01140 [Patescibacteria group bacterium]